MYRELSDAPGLATLSTILFSWRPPYDRRNISIRLRAYTVGVHDAVESSMTEEPASRYHSRIIPQTTYNIYLTAA